MINKNLTHVLIICFVFMKSRRDSATFTPHHLCFLYFFPSINYFPKLQIDTIWRKIFTFYWCYFFCFLLDPTDPFHFHTVSLSLSLGIELSLCFPQDLVKTGSFSNCTQLGMFLFYAFFSFHIHFLSVLSFWLNGFVFFMGIILVCVCFKSISITHLEILKLLIDGI